VQEAVQGADAVASSDLAYVETLSALTRMRAGMRLTAATQRAKRQEFEEFWSATVGVEVSADVVLRAGRLAEQHGLRAYDAVHLASALVVGEAEDVALSCWDNELRAAAASEGLALNP
jgi:predicted nucleic acid-binding protein